MTKKDLETAIINGTSIENANVKFDIDIHEFLYATKSEKPIIFKNCILQEFESTCIDFQEKIVFIDCTILALKMHGTTMKNGFVMKNCIVNSFFDISGCLVWSGENNIEFNGNYFGDVLTFEDTNFHNDLIFKNNKLIVGCDLVTEKQLACFYPSTSVIIDNYGIMNLSELEENKHWMRIRNMHNIK